jgi:hypothetical protein
MSRVEGLSQSGFQSGTLRAWEELHWKSLHHTGTETHVQSLLLVWITGEQHASGSHAWLHGQPEVVDEAKILVVSVLNRGPRLLSPGATKEAAESTLSLWPGVNLKCSTKESGPQGTEQAGCVGARLYASSQEEAGQEDCKLEASLAIS